MLRMHGARSRRSAPGSSDVTSHQTRMPDAPAAPAGEFTVGVVQMSCTASADGNRTVALDQVRAAAGRGAQIVCLPELFATRYFCQTEDPRSFDLAEAIPGPSTEPFMRLAAELQVAIIVPVFERRAAGLYHNSAVVIDASGDVLGVYRKMHIPDDPQYFEKFYFAPGDLGYRVFETRYAKVGVLICWDQWYPEAARLAALGGAELLVYPTAIGWLPADRDTVGEAQHDAWCTVQRGHAIANGIYVATVNRVGIEETAGRRLNFWGRSFICNPRGQLVAEASGERPEVLVAACSRQTLEAQRRDWPFLRDRRIDTYGPITQRFLDQPTGGPDPSAR